MNKNTNSQLLNVLDVWILESETGVDLSQRFRNFYSGRMLEFYCLLEEYVSINKELVMDLYFRDRDLLLDSLLVDATNAVNSLGSLLLSLKSREIGWYNDVILYFKRALRYVYSASLMDLGDSGCIRYVKERMLGFNEEIDAKCKEEIDLNKVRDDFFRKEYASYESLEQSVIRSWFLNEMMYVRMYGKSHKLSKEIKMIERLFLDSIKRIRPAIEISI